MTQPQEITADLRTLPDANARDLSHQQIGVLQQAFKDDLFFFAQEIFDYRDLVLHLHGELAELIKLWGTPEYMRLMIQVPRETFKTSLLTRANALWQVCREPDLPVVIFNERLDNTQKWLKTIREIVEASELFKAVFSDLVPPGILAGHSPPRGWKWSNDELQLQRGAIGIPEVSITGMGIGAASTGGHWPKIIKDDLISIEAKKSTAIMESAKAWFDTSLYLERPALKGMDLIVCTRWLYGDVYDYILRKYPDYKLYRRSALEDGESIFPEKWTTEELLVQQGRDPYNFSSQMQNYPMAGKEQNFDLKWLKWGSVRNDKFIIDREAFTDEVPEPHDGYEPTRVVPLSLMAKMILLDPAPSEESQKRKEPGARNGFVVEGMDPWGRKYILETVAIREDPLVVIDKVFELMEKWGTDTVGIEEVVFSIIYRHWLQREADARKKSIRCIRLEPGRRDKDTRIVGQIAPCKEGVYYINRAGTGTFVQEYVEYPYGETRDLLDAWAYDYRLQRPESMVERYEREIDSASGTQDPITGY